MKVKPINKRLIIKKVNKPDAKGQLLFVTEEHRYEPFFEIVEVSLDSNPDLQIGDKVYIDRYSHHAIEGTDDLFIVREENILGVINV